MNNAVTYTLIIPGEPVSKARPRFTKNGYAYTPEKTKSYELRIGDLYFEQYGQTMLDGAISADILAYFAVTKTDAKKKGILSRMISGIIRPTKKPDVDNIAKIILDSLNGIAYPDDKQVTDLSVKKRYSDKPRVELTICKIDEDVICDNFS